MRRPILFIVYFFVVTPLGIVWRLVRDPLRRSRGPRVRSYWTSISPEPEKGDLRINHGE